MCSMFSIIHENGPEFSVLTIIEQTRFTQLSRKDALNHEWMTSYTNTILYSVENKRTRDCS